MSYGMEEVLTEISLSFYGDDLAQHCLSSGFEILAQQSQIPVCFGIMTTSDGRILVSIFLAVRSANSLTMPLGELDFRLMIMIESLSLQLLCISSSSQMNSLCWSRDVMGGVWPTWKGLGGRGGIDWAVCIWAWAGAASGGRVLVLLGARWVAMALTLAVRLVRMVDIPHKCWKSWPTRGHRYKIGHTQVQTDPRCRSFSKRSVECWNNLTGHVVAKPNMNVFTVLLADSLGDALFSSQMWKFFSLVTIYFFSPCE